MAYVVGYEIDSVVKDVHDIKIILQKISDSLNTITNVSQKSNTIKEQPQSDNAKYIIINGRQYSINYKSLSDTERTKYMLNFYKEDLAKLWSIDNMISFINTYNMKFNEYKDYDAGDLHYLIVDIIIDYQKTHDTNPYHFEMERPDPNHPFCIINLGGNENGKK